MKSVRLLLRVVCVLLCAVCCISMARGISTADFGYYEEDLINPLKDRDVGGTDALTMQNADGRYTLESANVRIVLSPETVLFANVLISRVKSTL